MLNIWIVSFYISQVLHDSLVNGMYLRREVMRYRLY